MEVLGGDPPHPALTEMRGKLYRALWTEQLEANGGLDTWRTLCELVRDDKHLSTSRAYQMPESFLRNPERRERHTLAALHPPHRASDSEMMNPEQFRRYDERKKERLPR